VQPACNNTVASWSIIAGLGGPLSGTAEIDNGLLTGANVSTGNRWQYDTSFRVPGIPLVTYDLTYISRDEWTLSLLDAVGIYFLTFTDDNGLIADAVYRYSDVNPAMPVVTY
jgi:hypothetical protein